MPDATGGAGTGATGGGTGAGTGGTGAGAGTGAPAAGAAGGSGTTAPAWHGIEATDATNVEYVKNKGWTSPADVIRSYQGAEKLIGRDPNTLLVMPRGDDPAGLLAVMDKLGRPADAAKYEIPVPQGAKLNDDYANFARQAFHKIGLPASMGKQLVEANNAYVAEQATKAENAYKLSVTADKATLLSEWKGGHERMMNVAQTTAKQLGFSGELVDAIERQLGYAATMKMFVDMGKKIGIGEDGLVTGTDKTSRLGATMTPAEAKAEWEGMKADPNVQKALFDNTHPAHAASKEKQSRLFAIMYPDG